MIGVSTIYAIDAVKDSLMDKVRVGLLSVRSVKQVKTDNLSESQEYALHALLTELRSDYISASYLVEKLNTLFLAEGKVFEWYTEEEWLDRKTVYSTYYRGS